MKYVVIVETDDDFQMCIGVYDNPKEAYGAAYLWLDELLDGTLPVGKEDNVYISPLYPLEGDTGFGMKIVGRENIQERAHILFLEDNKKSDNSNTEAT